MLADSAMLADFASFAKCLMTDTFFLFVYTVHSMSCPLKIEQKKLPKREVFLFGL